MEGHSLDITAEKIAQLRVIFPEVFSEDQIDFARLKEVLGEDFVVLHEHYELSWAGKAEARKSLFKIFLGGEKGKPTRPFDEKYSTAGNRGSKVGDLGLTRQRNVRRPSVWE